MKREFNGRNNNIINFEWSREWKILKSSTFHTLLMDEMQICLHIHRLLDRLVEFVFTGCLWHGNESSKKGFRLRRFFTQDIFGSRASKKKKKQKLLFKESIISCANTKSSLKLKFEISICINLSSCWLYATFAFKNVFN